MNGVEPGTSIQKVLNTNPVTEQKPMLGIISESYKWWIHPKGVKTWQNSETARISQSAPLSYTCIIAVPGISEEEKHRSD